MKTLNFIKLVVTLLLFISAALSAEAQVDIYMRWPTGGVASRPMQNTGVSAPGSKDSDWVKLHSLSFGVTNSTTITSTSGGAGAGKAAFKEIEVIAPTDINTPNLLLTCCLGGHYDRAIASYHDRLTGKQLMQFEFFMVAVNEVAYTKVPESPDVHHRFKLVCGAIRVTYFPITKDGDDLPPTIAEWSVVRNAETTAVE